MEEPLHMISSSPVHQVVDPSSIFSASAETSCIVPFSSSSSVVENPPNPSLLPPPPQAATNNEAEEEDRKHKKRSKNWTRVETLRLIKLRTELEPRFSRGGRKTELWDEIAEGLRKEQFFRDAQQCRDKWEKLMAGFKDVREGLKDPNDNPYYDDLQPLLSGKGFRCRDRDKDASLKKEGDFEEASRVWSENGDDEGLVERSLRKRKRCGRYGPISDIEAVKALLEVVISRQQRFFKELLESLEKKEQIREQMRQEREEKWRAEERAHRNVFNNAMIVLAHRILGEKAPSEMGLVSAGDAEGTTVPAGTASASVPVPKKRSKNWKRGEVLQLIKLRGEMETRFANSARRAALWEELAEMLARQGIKRDGKQCREKWDKLMAAYKDVIDGKREEGDLSYFAELKAIVGAKLDDTKAQPELIQ
eukprot:TRINITY_DN10626_c0_g1_i1.p1 TRINITY_DN10626_c0_g1~~TRINITY_DN10626_c0_g1_i1.p1  ORF type:complete len:421 (-),score=91.45 TRINITY_DN10626_c0_g1_i1:225-1487(-)